MNWEGIKYFNESEFFGQAHLLDDQVIYNLNQLRKEMREPIYVSPAQGSIARIGGRETSQHYVGPTSKEIVRKSTAIDVFIEGVPLENYTHLCKPGLFNGIGIYLDTTGPDGKPWVMFHLDTRAKPLTWICTKGIKGENVYHYPVNDSSNWLMLMRKPFFTEREMR